MRARDSRNQLDGVAGNALRCQGFDHLPRAQRVEVAHEGTPRRQGGRLFQRRRLDLEHDAGFVQQRAPVGCNLRVGVQVVLVRKAGVRAPARLNHDAPASLSVVPRRARNERHPPLARLAFLHDCDLHSVSAPPWNKPKQLVARASIPPPRGRPCVASSALRPPDRRFFGVPFSYPTRPLCLVS